jgi:hypothetical protein
MRTATIHGNPRSASRRATREGDTTRTGLGTEAAWITVSRRLLPTTCDGCTGRGVTTRGAMSCFRTVVALGVRSVCAGEETSMSSGLARGTRPGREATRGLPDRGRSVATRGAVGVDAAADVSTGTSSSGAATTSGAGASETSTGGVVSTGGRSAAGAGGGSGEGALLGGGAGAGCGGGAGAGSGAGAGLGAGCGDGAGCGGGAGAARGGSSVSGSM